MIKKKKATIKKTTRINKSDLERHKMILLEIEKLESKDKLIGSLSFNKMKSPVEKMKWGICKEILACKISLQLSSKEIAGKMNLDKSKTSLILNYRIEHFTIDRLLNSLFALQGLNKATDKKIEKVFNLFDIKSAV